MESPWIVVTAILAVTAVYVLLPIVSDTFRRYRVRKILPCPETGEEAEVGIDAPRAALTSTFGPPLLQVRTCSLWPERRDCRQGCLAFEGPVPPPR
jgi:hypothetical protein